MSDEINEKELPEEGNSNARLYPPADQTGPEDRDDDPQQPDTGDAAAVREEGPNDAM